MKTSFSGFTSSLIFLLLLSTTAFAVGCDREDNILPTEERLLTDDQAAQIVEATLVGEQQGLDAAIADVVEVAEQTTPCGTSVDSTYTFTRNTDRLTANYDVDLQWQPTCGPGGLVRTITYQRTTEGNYNTNRLSSEDSSASSLSVGNITGGTSLDVNGSFTRTGTQQFTGRQQRSVTSECQISLANLKINKGTKRIESGQTTFTLTGTAANGQSFSVEGTIIFLGEGAATVVINGNQYQVNR